MFKVLTYNIHDGVGLRGRDYGRTYAVLRRGGAHCVGLQEVSHPLGDSMLADWAERLNMEYAFVAASVRDGVPFGNALLSSVPFRRLGACPLPSEGGEPRAALRARIRLRGIAVTLWCTHLGLSDRLRAAQLRHLARLLDADDAKLQIVLGDLNVWRARSATGDLLRRRFGRQTNPRSFPAWLPLLPLDRIHVSPPELLKDVRVVGGAEARLASDHRPVIGEIELPRAQGRAGNGGQALGRDG